MNTKTVAIGSLAVAITLLMLPTGALGDGDQKETAEYLNGPLGDVSWNTPMCDALLAQACFIAPGGASEVTITITDDSGLPVSFFVAGGASACGSVTLSVSGGDEIHVTANGAAFGALDCGVTSATTGTFTASFS